MKYTIMEGITEPQSCSLTCLNSGSAVIHVLSIMNGDLGLSV